MLARLFNLIVDHIIGIGIGLIARTKSLGDGLHIFACRRRMGLVNDDGKPFIFQIGNGIYDIGELLDGRCDDFCIMRQLIGQIS